MRKDLLLTDPETVIKKMLEINPLITQAEYCPSNIPQGKIMSFIFRLNGKRYGGSILAFQKRIDEASAIKQFLKTVENTK